ncbi:MAG: DUF1343 domain-containing protein [Ignavibacteriota bacterium]
MKKIPSVLFRTLLLIFFTGGLAAALPAQVRTGLDNLVSNKYEQLRGKKVGLITNRTSITSKGEFAGDLFIKQKSFKLVSFFSPEHGLFGERKAGVLSDAPEIYKGITVHSLYGSTRKPTKAMLKGIDVLVFDIQDIGVRPYTYLSTMIYAMEAAAANKIEFIVLDRPNPLSGDRIEGNILDSTFRSFVGLLPIPYLHGMTLGELAEMAQGEKWFAGADALKLTVIKMKDWYRPMYWNETGLKWVPPSPNIPKYESAIGCAMLGAIGEFGNISVGIGSDLPFLRLGSKLVKPELLEKVVTEFTPEGITKKREDFKVPFGDTTKVFAGMKLIIPQQMKSVGRIYGSEFLIYSELLKDSVFAKSFKSLPMTTRRMFEKVTGTKEILAAFESGRAIQPIIDGWKDSVKSFRGRRKKYLLYQ